jgi:hypothetical protein
MADTTSIEKNVGSGGFDWSIHQYSPVGADDDMRLGAILGLAQPVVVNRDRWQETEAVSGSKLNDVIKGDDLVPSTLGGAGFTGCDVIDAAGQARIAGLNAILPPLTGALQPVIDNSAAGECPLSGPIWGEGNILLGGGGSDTITGRGADDIIDGDRELTVRISVRSAPGSATEIGSTDLMEKQYQTNPTTGALTGPTLMAAVAAGTIDPDQLVVTRAISNTPDPTKTDTAVFFGTRADYTITFAPNTPGRRTVVTQTGPLAVDQTVSDGTDTLRNIEKLQFSDQTVTVGVPNAPSNVNATAAPGSALLTWTRATTCVGCPPITGQQIVVNTAGTPVAPITVAAGASSATVPGLTNGTSYTFQVRAVNAVGDGPLSAASNAVIPRAAPGAPGTPTLVRGNTQLTANWTAPASDGASPITSYVVEWRVSGSGTALGQVTVPATPRSRVITGLTNGTQYRVRVQAINAIGAGPFSALTALVNVNGVPATVPGAPTITAARSGLAVGAPIDASVDWTAPADNGGQAITGYTVRAIRMSADGVTPLAGAPVVSVNAGNVLTRTVAGLVAGAQYRFEVLAVNGTVAPLFTSAPSARSGLVTAQ